MSEKSFQARDAVKIATDRDVIATFGWDLQPLASGPVVLATVREFISENVYKIEPRDALK